MLTRKHFPFYEKLDLQFDPEKIMAELKILEELNGGWNDMKTNAPLIKELTHGRDRLTQVFQNDDGEYHSYEQIICTEYNEDQNATKTIDATGGTLSQYKQDMDKAKSGLNESAYNQLRPMMDNAPYIRDVLEQFQDPISRARFARIQPDFQIKPHIDYCTRYGMRYHIALTTNDDCKLGFRHSPKDDFEVLHIPVDGHVYFVNAGFEHYAENMGDTERTHFVVGVTGQSLMNNA